MTATLVLEDFSRASQLDVAVGTLGTQVCVPQGRVNHDLGNTTQDVMLGFYAVRKLLEAHKYPMNLQEMAYACDASLPGGSGDVYELPPASGTRGRGCSRSSRLR